LGEVPLYGARGHCFGASRRGIEVDKSKIDTIAKLPVPTNVKEVRGILGHASFYRRFIQNFSKITQPLNHLLTKDAVFDFNQECSEAFEKLKFLLTSAPIISAPDWSHPFIIMCDASDVTVGVVLGQKIEGKDHVISYVSKTLSDA
jgi:hypothetical protein